LMVEAIMDLDSFFSEENLARYRLLASSTDADQRRKILRLLAEETAKVKSELRRRNHERRIGEARH
jgi:hypothetical protein